MPITLEKDETSRSICLEGECSIVSAGELKTLLMDTLSAKEPLFIRLERATGLDVCIVQLLVAAIREWKQIGVSCALTGALTEGLLAMMRDAGFETLPIALPVALDEGILSEV